MVKRVLSIVRGADIGGAGGDAPALDLNAYAVAEDVELTLVLADRAVEYATRSPDATARKIATVALPATDPRADLVALVASGVRVVALSDDLDGRGLGPDDLLEGVGQVSTDELADLFATHDVALTTSNA